MTAVKSDTTLTGAVDLARDAAHDVAEPGAVGEHLEVIMEGERLATHYFACTHAAYRGWRWAVTVARAPRQKYPTVCEAGLVPGEGAILAPEWLPYAARIAPGDLSVGDLLPYRADDPNLEAGFEATGDEDVDQFAFTELGLGRKRVLSQEGRVAAAERWYSGGHGPRAEIAEKAPEQCGTCGYWLPMAGALRRCFGVCANEWSPSDGRVVRLDHGCGAHSEIDPEPESVQLPGPLVDEYQLDVVDRLDESPGPAEAAEEAEVLATEGPAVEEGVDTNPDDVTAGDVGADEAVAEPADEPAAEAESDG